MMTRQEIQRLCAYGLYVTNGTILLVRASSVTEVAGRWFLPGGGVDHGEHPEDALRRELIEETGLSVEIGSHLGIVSDVRSRRDGTSVHTVRLIYAIDDATGTLASEASGSSDLAAFVPLERARRIPLARYVVKGAAFAGIDLRVAQSDEEK